MIGIGLKFQTRENISMHLCVSLWVAHVLLIQFQFCYYCINCNWNSIYCNTAYFEKYLALHCQLIISDKPLVYDFLGQQSFLSRQNLFCLLWWRRFKVCTTLVAYPLLLNIHQYSNCVRRYLMHKSMQPPIHICTLCYPNSSHWKIL